MRVKFIVLASLISLIVLGCGGGGEESTPSLGGGGGGSSSYIRINSFDLTPKTLSDGTKFDVTWSVSHSSPTGLYWLELHFFQENAIPIGMSGLTRHFYANCNVPLSDCGRSGVIKCEVKNIAGMLSTICNIQNSSVTPQSRAFILSGDGYAILRACVYDSYMRDLCDQKSVPVKVVR